MDLNMVFSYDYSSQNRRRRRTNVLRRGPFRWPWRCADAIQSASPDAACPGLHQKPLNAAIGRLLAPYRPGGRQGNNQQNNDVLMYPLTTIGRALAPILPIGHTSAI